MDQLDQESLFPQVTVSEQFLYESEHLIVGLTYALAKIAKADRTLNDQDLISALRSIAKSYQTLVNSGLVYELPVAAIHQQAIASEVHTMVKEYREAEHKHLGYTRLKDGDVLRALVFLLRMGLGRTSGRPKSRAFVEFVLSQFPEKTSTIAAPQETGSSLIIP